MREEKPRQNVSSELKTGQNCHYLWLLEGERRVRRLVWPCENETFPPFPKRTTGVAISPFLEMYLRLHLGHCMSPQYASKFVLIR
jgi:hypothetical protein